VDSAALKSEIRELNSRRLTDTPRSSPTHAQAAAVFDIGEEYEFEIIKDDDGDGSLTLSVRKIQVSVHPPNFASRSSSLKTTLKPENWKMELGADLLYPSPPHTNPQLEAAWNRCRELQNDDEAVNSVVLSVNRGGLLVEVEHLRGFVPQSHIAIRVPNREDLIGQSVPVKFLEVDEEKNRLVMSNRLATDVISGEGLGVGDVVTGIVQAVKPYGAFVDVGGVSGLLHISQISHDRIVAVENVLAPGDELKVLILSKDAERSRLSLSTKKLEPSPGDMLRNPALVFEKADEMGRLFRERVAAAEAAAQAEEGAQGEMAGMEVSKSADEEESKTEEA
jgi:small subunit ribosomal protein S1